MCLKKPAVVFLALLLCLLTVPGCGVQKRSYADLYADLKAAGRLGELLPEGIIRLSELYYGKKPAMIFGEEQSRTEEEDGTVCLTCNFKFESETVYVSSWYKMSYDVDGEVWKLKDLEELGDKRCVKMTIPRRAKKITADVFGGNAYITDLTIGDGISDIEPGSFRGCPVLRTVKMGDGVTTVAAAMFQDCPALASVTFSENIWMIQPDAFAGCAGLTELDFPENLNAIYSGAFRDCSGLKTLKFPSTLIYAEAGAFENCPSLKNITLADGNTVFRVEKGKLVTISDGTVIAETK